MSSSSDIKFKKQIDATAAGIKVDAIRTTYGAINLNTNRVSNAGDGIASKDLVTVSQLNAAIPSGIVTAVSVASANGFAGSSSGGSTPALTLTIPATGILKSNGTAVGAAIAADFPTLNQNTTGSAATLTTPRNINGVAFDGSAAITITAAATKYTQAFVVADWVSASPDYTLTITGATHGKGLFPVIQVFQSAAGVNSLVNTVVEVTAASGDVVLKVSLSPDNRFDGVIIIL